MDIRFKPNTRELIVEAHFSKITEDVAIYSSKECKVDETIADKLVQAAVDMYRFNGKTDIEIVKEIYEVFLTFDERGTFLKLITSDKSAEMLGGLAENFKNIGKEINKITGK